MDGSFLPFSCEDIDLIKNDLLTFKKKQKEEDKEFEKSLH